MVNQHRFSKKRKESYGAYDEALYLEQSVIIVNYHKDQNQSFQWIDFYPNNKSIQRYSKLLL